jgi:hypothetical protein
MEIEWEDPPEIAVARVRTPGRYIEFAFALKDHPGRWAKLPAKEGEAPRSEKGAANLAQSIRRGTTAGFQPKGGYEAVANEGAIWVRFKDEEATEGGEKAAEPEATAPAKAPGPDPVKVRQWARTNGLGVPDRGRLPENIIEAYNKAIEGGNVGLGLRAVPRGDSGADAR